MSSEETSAAIALTGLVKGRVQGVFFRAETRNRARQLGLAGWVKNTPDGDVSLLIAGPPLAIASMREWLSAGPPLARVDSLELTECTVPEIEGFEIRY